MRPPDKMRFRPRAPRKSRARPTMPLDLFGQIPVSEEDVRLWLRTIAQLEPDSPRAAAYARNYDVAGKCAQAKARGEWPPTR